MAEYEDFRRKVLAAIRQIPEGKVTTYGHVAKLVGKPKHSRHVGAILRTLTRAEEGDVPWQRVINHRGRVSLRDPRDSVRRQAEILQAEGVEIHQDEWLQWTVSLRRHGWFPEARDIRL
ncbi:DNA binding methylated-DNA--cysteine S-methyltransferase [Gonapodya prolifera JEL478]|uniref:DNA binding methylated-DNA--cysteine S-methyltransferase n=1 Tax=Gonapodya prolifera (strain JEL478) TaxID=1344416 RepID=A0A139ASQ5_GONPJ|nr:DNA binding methylated-DNA--cysteine S-methyltransferase [Gonapodya prolifera JEL478]|eukprot:KXS19777.1 DNA binding methylated-DNA--cysteine S-methyltransferase [Gonapodya prolifera JEL478]